MAAEEGGGGVVEGRVEVPDKHAKIQVTSYKFLLLVVNGIVLLVTI